jgi:hypothetical protein
MQQQAPDTRLSRREVTGNYAVKNWNYGTIARMDVIIYATSLFNKISLKTLMHKTEWRINETFLFYYYSYIVWRRAREPILPVTGYFILSFCK